MHTCSSLFNKSLVHLNRDKTSLKIQNGGSASIVNRNWPFKRRILHSVSSITVFILLKALASLVWCIILVVNFIFLSEIKT